MARYASSPNGSFKQFNPRWSPDGKWIAYFEEKDDDHDQLWIMSADGSGKRRVTDGSGHNVFPNWARDGRHLLFIGKRDQSGLYFPYRIDVDGSGLVRIGKERADYVAQAPDGSLLFIRPFKDGSVLATSRSDGSGQRMIH